MACFLFHSKMFYQLRNSAESHERSDNCVKWLAESMEGFSLLQGTVPVVWCKCPTKQEKFIQ